MKVTIIHTGKTKFPYIDTVCQDYYQRINKYLPVSELKTSELKNPAGLPVEMVKAREGEQVLKLINVTDHLVLFDERGVQHSSVSFAAWLEKLFMAGKPLVFVTGGAYGFSGEVYRRANDRISLSLMTFPHQLVRILVAEQIYRAMTIIKGEKYHH